VKNSIYQESISNPNGVHWDVKVGRYRIVRDNLIQCSHGTILTPWTIAFVANVAPKAFVVKQKKLDKENTLISALHLLSSTFIDLSDSANEDVFLPMNFDVNVFGSFFTLVLDVYLVEDVPSN